MVEALKFLPLIMSWMQYHPTNTYTFVLVIVAIRPRVPTNSKGCWMTSLSLKSQVILKQIVCTGRILLFHLTVLRLLKRRTGTFSSPYQLLVRLTFSSPEEDVGMESGMESHNLVNSVETVDDHSLSEESLTEEAKSTTQRYENPRCFSLMRIHSFLTGKIGLCYLDLPIQ